MKIIISPAKKMNINTDLGFNLSKPVFLDQASIIKDNLKKLTYDSLKKVWKCNDDIANLNFERIKNMDFSANLSPAILSYEGIQFKYMAPEVFDKSQYDYIDNNLRIISGLYGVLSPFDGIVLYRLEMQSKLLIGNNKNLYQFWSDKIYSEVAKDTDFVLNLASKEYSKTVLPFASIPVINCVFGEINGNKIVEKGTMCKMARGEMVRWLAKNNVKKIEDIKYFDSLEYEYNVKQSQKNNLVFIKKQILKEDF